MTAKQDAIDRLQDIVELARSVSEKAKAAQAAIELIEVVRPERKPE